MNTWVLIALIVCGTIFACFAIYAIIALVIIKKVKKSNDELDSAFNDFMKGR